MNTLTEDLSTSACVISFNQYNQFILKSADTTFLEKFGLTRRSIDAAIINTLPKELTDFLCNLYIQHHTSDGAFTRYLKLQSPCYESHKIYLTVTLHNINDSVNFICRPIPIIEDNLGIISSLNCCGIRDGKISSVSTGFCEFLERFNLPPEDFSEGAAVTAADESGLPHSKLYIFSDGIQAHLYMTTAIPSVNSPRYDYLLFLNKIPPESNLSNLLHLTPREFEAIKLASKGYTNRNIGDILGITEGCAARLLSNSYSKLQVSSKLEIYNLF